ncbi:hypothetical protein L211DRAFT_820876, partial [Terfezia boudieri ATCC MYA-4762]
MSPEAQWTSSTLSLWFIKIAKMNDAARSRGRNILPIVLCVSILHIRGTSAQSAGLNETQVSDIVRQDINQIQGLGQEFGANFFTDLAPLLILFGDQVVRQYMAQSQDWADHIIFAMGPLGIATALTGAVRMCGQKFFRGVVGRGRETKQIAEFELTSATSEDIYEVWDGESIVRVMGEQTFQEIRLQKEGKNVVIKQLFHDTEDHTHLPIWKRWSGKRKSGPKQALPSKPRMGPNLSLNAIHGDISPLEKWICAAISVMLQVFVIVWAALVQYKLPVPEFRKDGRMGEFRSYSFPCMAVGTISVITSMLLCSYVVDRAMERKLIAPKTENLQNLQWRPCWIQKWGKADDQSFDSYIIFGSLHDTRNPRDVLVTLHPRRQEVSASPGHLGEREVPGFLVRLTEVACILGVVGFFIMVAGSRSLHWSVPAAQLGQTLFMVLLRSYTRRKVNADDIRVVKVPRGFEMEWLVTRRDQLWEKLDKWNKAEDFWKPEAKGKWSLVTGEKVVREEEITRERGSITVGETLTEITRENIEKLDTTLDQNGNPKRAQMVLNDLKTLLHSNQKWDGNASGFGNALVRTMECTLNTLLPSTVMNSILPSKIGLVNSSLGPTPEAGVVPWPNGTKGRVWHWPIVVQMEVNSAGSSGVRNTAPQMEEQIVRISLIQREGGGWFVMKEGVEALLTLWLFTLKQRRINPTVSDHVNMPPFVRLIGSNTELARWDIMRWYGDHCSRVYEGKCMTITQATNNTKQEDEIDIEMDRTLDQVMGIEQVDLRSENESARERNWEESVQQTPTPHRARNQWHYFRGRELPEVVDEDQPQNRDGREYTSLATTVECSLEELCAQEILFRFFFAIGTFMREERGIRLQGNTILSSRNTATTSLDADTTPERRLKAAKFHNSILERIALEAYHSKVCGSLEVAYQCIIPAFSQSRVLPEVGEVVRSQVTQIFRELVGKGDWIKACDLYNWVWTSMGCKFPHHSNEDLHVIALFTNFVRKLRHEANTGCHGGSLTRELAAKSEVMLKVITEREFQGRDVVQALGLILQSLDELDSEMQTRIVGGELIPDSTPTASQEGAPEGLPTMSAAKGGECQFGVDKLFLLLGFTPSHLSMANILGGEQASADLERNVNMPDIFQRRPLHYAAANPALDKSILELLIRKTSGVDQKDINGNTPLHLAASRNNPNFTAILKELSLEEDLEMRKKSMVDFNATNELRQTPLHLAAWKGHPDMVDELIKEGAIIDADDNSNRSPLHWAAQGGNLDVVTSLIQKGANTKVLDAYG